MTVKEIETLIPVALERFKQRIPQSVEWIDNVPIRVATRHTGEKLFRSTIKSLKAWEKEYSPQTVAEAFSGENGYAIIVYQHRIKAEKQLLFVLWHELGHICSNIANSALETEGRADILNKRDTPIASGCAVWMEFIADAVANYVGDLEPTRGVLAWSIQEKLMRMAAEGFNNGNFSTAAFGHYYGLLLTDVDTVTMLNYYTTDEETPEIGFGNCRLEVQMGIGRIAAILDAHLDQNGYFGNDRLYRAVSDAFWRIPRKTLELLGMAFDDLYDTCLAERLCFSD